MRITGLVAALLLLASFDARATFYKYRDNSGAIVITDKLENVPLKYRTQYKVIFDEDLDAKDPLKRRWAVDTEAREKREREENKRKAAEEKKPGNGKRLVITVDEATGELIRTVE